MMLSSALAVSSASTQMIPVQLGTVWSRVRSPPYAGSNTLLGPLGRPAAAPVDGHVTRPHHGTPTPRPHHDVTRPHDGHTTTLSSGRSASGGGAQVTWPSTPHTRSVRACNMRPIACLQYAAVLAICGRARNMPQRRTPPACCMTVHAACRAQWQTTGTAQAPRDAEHGTSRVLCIAKRSCR
jgi:hypothetical protein